MMQRRNSIGLEEEIPPAYTPSADVHHGETTIEVGPQRPFQQQRPESSRPASIPSHSTSHSHSSSTSSWSQPQSQQRRQLLSQSQESPPQQQSTWTASTPYAHPNVWSTHPSQRHQRRGVGLVGLLLDTVRDVVDGVAGAHEEQIRPQAQLPTSSYTAPRAQSVSSSAPPQHHIPDDGSPTSTPTPGHPLLNHDHLLVYPSIDHLCPKCQNTGYKNYDPSHPCKKCWERYGKPYTGPLTYMPWSTSSSSSPSHASKFQRPLPRFTPPQASRSRRRDHHQDQQQLDEGQSLYVCNPIIGIGEHPPVPHAIPVPPGDTRLGGRMCWRCGGLGTLPLLIFDVRPCTACDGIGRILR